MIVEIPSTRNTICRITVDVRCEIDQSCCSYKFMISHTTNGDTFSMVSQDQEGCCCENDCYRMQNFLQLVPCKYDIEHPTIIYSNGESPPPTTSFVISLMVFCTCVLAIGISPLVWLY